MPRPPPKGLDTLLDLDGERIVFDDGTWVRFEVGKVKPTSSRPHGLAYSLTYHDRHNRRILGFDNAHAATSRHRHGFRARRIEYDHKHLHPKDKGEPFYFDSPEQLLIEFWNAVDEWRKQQ